MRVARVSAGSFEVGHGDDKAVEHDCGEVWVRLSAGKVAECGGGALKSEIGRRIGGARPGW